jgi:uncharacterized membrane protein YccC
MAIWMGTRTRNFDAFGRLLHRFGSMFIGIGLGLEVAHFFPSLSFLLLMIFAFVLGFALIGFANSRAKTQTENTNELRVN